MMDDLISRQAAMAYPLSWEHYDKEHGDRKFICGVESYREYIESLPSAQKKGHWIHDTTISLINNMEISLPAGVCNVCDIHVEYTSKFCPNCGADMREDGETDG